MATAPLPCLRESKTFVEHEALLDPRFFAGFLKHGRVASDWPELKDQHGPRLWARHKAKIPEAEKPRENRLTLRGGLLFMLLAGYIFTMPETSIAAVARLLEDLQLEEKRRLLEEYRRRSAFEPIGGEPEFVRLASDRRPANSRGRRSPAPTASA